MSEALSKYCGFTCWDLVEAPCDRSRSFKGWAPESKLGNFKAASGQMRADAPGSDCMPPSAPSPAIASILAHSVAGEAGAR